MAETNEPTEPSRTLFGWKSPGLMLSLLAIAAAFILTLLYGWLTGRLDCPSFAACPWFSR